MKTINEAQLMKTVNEAKRIASHSSVFHLVRNISISFIISKIIFRGQLLIIDVDVTLTHQKSSI